MLYVTVVIVENSTVEPLSFLQVNVSGGEPRDVQDMVREELMVITKFDGDGGSIIGAATQNIVLQPASYTRDQLTSSM